MIFDTNFNRYTNLDNLDGQIFNYLINDESKYANNLFRLLKYDTQDALYKPELTIAEKRALLYTTNGDASDERVFFSPFVDDIFESQCSQLYIYVQKIIPQNHVISKVVIGFDLIVHNKISNVYGDASVDNPCSNPSEIDKEGNISIFYKNRATVMLKSLLASLNGSFVNGGGTLMFSKENSDNDYADMSVFNGRKFYGYHVNMSATMSGHSENPMVGY